MKKDSKRTLISKDLLDVITIIGDVSNIIQMRDVIKFGENESFKDHLYKDLSQLIDSLSKATLFYNINYVYTEDADNQMDINIILNRLMYHATRLLSAIREKEQNSKKLNKIINSIVFYIKMICLVYDIDSNNQSVS